LAVARQLDLDLVEVAPDANPPVCRIMDYNRFKYETAQRAKESRKKATNTSIKEMKYRPKISIGDFTTKTRQVGRFLEEGHKVKVTIMFRGREVSHPELGMKILEELAEQVSSVSKVEAAPKLDGRNMVMVLAPDRRAKQARKAAAQGAAPVPNGQVVQSAGPGAAAPAPVGPGTVAPVGEGAAPVPAEIPVDAPAAPAAAGVTTASEGPTTASKGPATAEPVPQVPPANGSRRSDGHATKPRSAAVAASATPADGAVGLST
jgi:translation initiation factor IF-3